MGCSSHVPPGCHGGQAFWACSPTDRSAASPANLQKPCAPWPLSLFALEALIKYLYVNGPLTRNTMLRVQAAVWGSGADSCPLRAPVLPKILLLLKQVYRCPLKKRGNWENQKAFLCLQSIDWRVAALQPSGSAVFSQFSDSGLGRDATCCFLHSVSLSFVTGELLLMLQLQPTNPSHGQGAHQRQSWGGNLVLRGSNAVCFLLCLLLCSNAPCVELHAEAEIWAVPFREMPFLALHTGTELMCVTWCAASCTTQK